MLKTLIIILVICSAFVYGQTADYCASSLCSGKKHVACGNNGAFSSTCRAGRGIVDIAPFKAFILSKHNTYRNQVAAGKLPGFKPATRMATMQWDDELAKLAVLNVKQCAMKHDACRNTARFKYSGQNLAWRWGRPAPTTQQAITASMNSWFIEYKDANQATIDSYPQSWPRVIGHFTVMIADRNNRVGCGLLYQPRPTGGGELFFACNYAHTNIFGRPIYATGTAASKCTKGKNSQFPALCHALEPIDPNKIA